jgi:hypothetical protein
MSFQIYSGRLCLTCAETLCQLVDRVLSVIHWAMGSLLHEGLADHVFPVQVDLAA